MEQTNRYDLIFSLALLVLGRQKKAVTLNTGDQIVGVGNGEDEEI